MKINLIHTQGFDLDHVTNIPIKTLTFSGGEEHVVIDASLGSLVSNGDRIVLHHEVRSSHDWAQLIMIKSAIDGLIQFKKVEVILVMFYIPYARQDRRCEEGEAEGAKVFAQSLNSLRFDRVIVADPHSDISVSHIHNVQVIPQEDIVKEMLGWYVRSNNFALVSPDGGALKKIYKVSKALGGVEVFNAEKIRDTKTGQIIKTNINIEDFEGKNLLIVDDIADGSMTFLKLAQLLKERNAGKVDLYVTHGIFSKGVELLSSVDHIHSFNIWESNLEEEQQILLYNQEIIQDKFLVEDLGIYENYYYRREI